MQKTVAYMPAIRATDTFRRPLKMQTVSTYMTTWMFPMWRTHLDQSHHFLLIERVLQELALEC